MKLIFPRATFLLVCIFWSQQAFAGVTLRTDVLENGEELLITFSHDNVQEMVQRNCHFNLFAADKRRDLKTLPGKGLSIATFYKPEEEISIIAVQLHRLSRKKFRRKSQNVYLRVLIPCEDESFSFSDWYTATIPTKKKGKVQTLDRLIKRMKYHMRYATEEERQAALK